MPINDDEDLFDVPRPKPSNKIVYQPAGAQWSLDRLGEVENLYQTSFKKKLPLVNRGQGSIHNRWGYDHRDSADVSINPSTPEGQQFVEELKKANVPFLAFSGAIPGVATGPHIHLGFPSKRTQTRFNVGAQRKTESVASDDLFDPPQKTQSDDDLFDLTEQIPPSTPQRQRKSAVTPASGQSAQSIPEGLLLPKGQRNRTDLFKLPTGHVGRATRVLPENERSNLFRQLGQQRTIEQAQRDEEAKARADVIAERQSRKVPFATFGTMVDLVTHPVQSVIDAFSPEGDVVNRKAAELVREREVARSPEAIAIRKDYGSDSGLLRSGLGPLDRLTAATLENVGGLSSAFGIKPNSLSKWAYKRAEILNAASSAPPLTEEHNLSSQITGQPELKEVERGVPEKVLTGLADLGLGVGQIMALKSATGFSMPTLLALEGGLRASNKPIGEQISAAGEGFLLGKALDANLSRTSNSALFGAPTAAQTGYEVYQGRMSPLDAAIQTGIQAGAGALLTPRETAAGARLRDIAANEPPPDTSTFTPLSPRVNLRERMARNATTTAIPEVATPERGRESNILPTATRGVSREPVIEKYLDAERPTNERTNAPIVQPNRAVEQPIVRQQVDTAAELGRAENAFGQQHSVAKYLEGSPFRNDLLRELPAGAKLAGLNAESPEMQSGPVRLRAPNGDIWEIDLSYGHQRDPGWKIVGPKMDGFAIRKTGENIREPQAKVQPPVEAGPLFAKGEAGRHNQQVLDAIATTADKDAYVIAGGQRLKVQQSNYGMFGRSIGHEIHLADGSVIDAAIVNRVEDANGKVLYEKKPPVEAQREAVEPQTPITNTASVPFMITKKMETDLRDRGYSQSDINRMTPQQAHDALASESAPQPQKFYHRDFGEVVKTEDQSGARAGRTRVQEVNDPDKIHYVKTTQLTGRGNERMVPVKPEPEAQPEQQTTSTPAETAPQLEPPPPSITSARKEAMSADRAELDLPELPAPERKSWQTSLERAKPEDASRLADEVLSKPRALNDEETASLVVRAQQIKNEHAQVMKEIGEAKGDALSTKQRQAESLEQEFDKLTRATKESGTEKGRALAAQKLTINQDYDLVSLIQRAKAAKGRDLTPEERTRYEKMASEIESLNKQLSEANDKLAQKNLQKQIDRTVRRGNRAETRQQLDDEFADLRAQFAQARAELPKVQASGLAGLDPEGRLTKLILQMAHNRVRAGVTDAAQLVDDIHSAVSEHIQGISKRDIRDAISGYGLEPKTHQSDLAKQLAQIRSELRKISTQEDVEAGKRLSPRDKTRQAQLLKQEAELQRRLSQRDFSPKPKREPVEYDKQTQAIAERVESLKNQFNREMERERPGRWWRNLSGMRKAWLLSGPMTHIRNIVGTVAYQPFDEFSRLPAVVIDAALSKATGQRGIQGPSPAAMLDSVVTAVKEGGRDAVSILKHGATKEDLARHQFSEIDTGVKAIDIAHNAIFRFMSASDRVSYKGAYKRNLIDRANIQAKNEKQSDPAINVRERARALVEDPPDELRASAEHDALVNTFNNSNVLSDAIKRGRSALSPQANFAIDLVMPFDRTPTNVIARVLEASPYGYARNAKQLAQSIIKKSMSVEEQRAFSQTFGRATAGTALIALGFALAGKGVLTWEDKRKSINLQIGERKINLSAISPIGSILAIGAGLYRERGSPKGQVKAALSPVAEQPLIRGVSELGSLITDSDRTLPRVGGRFASSFIPFSGALRTAAQALDPKERKAKTFKENIQQNVPIWRNQLPENVDTSRRSRRVSFTERMREGKTSDAELEAAKQRGEITESDIKRINREAGMTARQSDFTNKQPAAALEAYENMTPMQRDHVKDIMARKAYTLLNSEALTDQQKEEFRQRIEALGIEPEAPRRQSSNPFSQRFRSSFK